MTGLSSRSSKPLYGPPKILSDSDIYQQLAQAMREAHEVSYIASTTTYELGGETRYVSMGDEGKAFEYAVRDNQLRKLDNDDPGLAKLMRKAHGNSWIYSTTTYELGGETRYVSMGGEKAFAFGQERVEGGVSGAARLSNDEKESLKRQLQALEARKIKVGKPDISDMNFETSSPIFNDSPGGIDLNPKKFNLEIKTNNYQPSMSVDTQNIINSEIQGFVPIIIKIIPAAMPLFLSDLKS